MLATRGGHPACCRLLLSHGADADAQGSRGETPLMAAIVAGSAELVELLLPATSDLTARSDAGLCALALACLHRLPWALNLLLRRQHVLLTGAAALDSTAGSGPSSSGSPSSCGASASAPPHQPNAASATPYSAVVPSQRLAAGQQLLLAMYAAVASGDAASLQQLVEHPLTRAAHDAQFGSVAAAAAAAAPLRMPGQEESKLQDGLSFLLDPAVVGQRNVRAASFLWQTSESFLGCVCRVWLAGGAMCCWLDEPAPLCMCMQLRAWLATCSTTVLHAFHPSPLSQRARPATWRQPLTGPTAFGCCFPPA